MGVQGQIGHAIQHVLELERRPYVARRHLQAAIGLLKGHLEPPYAASVNP